MSEYVSVKEFAELAGISKQAVYSQLDTRLKDYVVKVEKGTRIDKRALSEFYSSQPVKQVEREKQSSFNQVEQSENTTNSAEMGRILDVLSKQLDTKDKQIDELNKRLAEAYAVINQQQVLLDQQQKLTLVEKKEDIRELAATVESKVAENETPKKQKIFSRLFGKVDK